MRVRIFAVLIAWLAYLPIGTLPVQAHHGWSAYDTTKLMRVEARIEALRYQNPHGEIEISYEGKLWVVVLAPPMRMLLRGLPPEDLKPGTMVVVEGHAQRDGEPEMKAERLTVNGKTVELDAGWYLTLSAALAELDAGWYSTLASALEVSPLGVAMRESTFLYPLVNVVHLIGLVLIVGAMALLDLRLLGLARPVPVVAVYPILTRIAAVGIGVQLASGFMLFASDAPALLRNDAFLLKMLLLAAALANAAVFRLLWRSRVATWDDRPPLLGLVQAALSFSLWLSIGVLGRLIAYA